MYLVLQLFHLMKHDVNMGPWERKDPATGSFVRMSICCSSGMLRKDLKRGAGGGGESSEAEAIQVIRHSGGRLCNGSLRYNTLENKNKQRCFVKCLAASNGRSVPDVRDC